MAEAIVVLVPAPDFKSGGGRGDTSSAGSIPVRFRQTEFGFVEPEVPCLAQNHTGTTISDFFLDTLRRRSVERRRHGTGARRLRTPPPPEVRGRSNDCRHPETGV